MNSSILKSILLKSKENKDIISVWQYNGDKSSLVGYVSDIAEEHVNFQLYTHMVKVMV
ncbi:hypothetical protein [Flavobacterium nitratireducens]|uniref:hypothetical protein n=1 Tax=Flavobacterium nitratireducens TaxID=992289 RepID=UPI002414E14C|nr:hypothetical protein [Flavobacterium nitratireducens]